MNLAAPRTEALLPLTKGMDACAKPPPPPIGWWRSAQKNFVSQNPDPFLLEINRIEEAGMRKQFESALRLTEKALQKRPDCHWVWVYRAAVSFLCRKPHLALEACRALDVCPVESFYRYPELALPPDFCSPEAVRSLDAVLENPPVPRWALALKALTLRYHLRYEEAVPWMERAAANSGQAALLVLCSRFRLNTNADNRKSRVPKSALEELRRAVRLAPKAGWIRVWLGEALRHRGEHRAALFQLNKGLKLNPDYAVGQIWKAAVLRKLGQPKQALEILTASIVSHFKHGVAGGTDPTWAWALNERHLALRDLRQWEEAARTLCDAHVLNNRYLWHWENKPAGALRELDEGLKQHKGSSALLLWKGAALLEAGRRREALEILKQASLKAGDDHLVWAWMAEAERSSGNLREARACAKKSLELEPGYALAFITLGRIALDQKCYEEARSFFQNACRMDPVNASAFTGLGMSLMALKSYPQAGYSLIRAIRIYPQHEQAAAALKKLAGLPWKINKEKNQ